MLRQICLLSMNNKLNVFFQPFTVLVKCEEQDSLLASQLKMLSFQHCFLEASCLSYLVHDSSLSPEEMELDSFKS